MLITSGQQVMEENCRGQAIKPGMDMVKQKLNETKRSETNRTGNHTQNIDSADRASCLHWTQL